MGKLLTGSVGLYLVVGGIGKKKFCRNKEEFPLGMGAIGETFCRSGQNSFGSGWD